MILNFIQMYTLPFINRFFKDLVIVHWKPKLLVAKLLREYNLFQMVIISASDGNTYMLSKKKMSTRRKQGFGSTKNCKHSMSKC
jgi:hypothetical protein